MPSSERRDASWACRRYEEIRPRLPSATFPATSRRIDNLGDLIDEIDVFVLDGFGVLNVGASVVPGAPERMMTLRAAGKRLFVLTNGASYPTEQSVEKYRRLGFDFTRDEVVSSRDALALALAGRKTPCWGFAAKEESAIGEFAINGLRLGDDRNAYETAGGFVLLSTGDWNRDRQELLVASLNARPRPVLVGNPDLVAPRENGLSIEPGFFAHELADRTGCAPEFFGKPFANAFGLVRERLGGVPGHRIAMVGDTLHTDILGGAAMGWRTVLVMDHGLLRGFDVGELTRISDITADFVARTT